MSDFTDFFNDHDIVLEATTKGDLNIHLSHMEDLAIEEGKDGYQKFNQHVAGLMNYIRGLDSKVKTSIKADGAPALYFGMDPRPHYQGQFFIATKSGFSKAPKICHTDFEIEHYFEQASAEFVKILKIALKELRKAYDGSGFMYHGDLLFAGHEHKKEATVGGEKYVYVKPNIVAYAVPVDQKSILYHRITAAELGIIIHASYKPEVTADGSGLLPRATGSDDFTSLIRNGSKMNVFIEDSVLDNPINFEIPAHQLYNINELLNTAASYISQIDDQFDQAWKSGRAIKLIKMYLNSQVRTKSGGIFQAVKIGEEYDHEKFVSGFKSFIKEKYDNIVTQRKTERGKLAQYQQRDELFEWIDNHYASFENLMYATFYMIHIKKEFLKIFDLVEGKLGKMFSEDENGDLVVSRGEGFVISIGSNQIKLVDRLDFSRLNFLRGSFRKQ